MQGARTVPGNGVRTPTAGSDAWLMTRHRCRNVRSCGHPRVIAVRCTFSSPGFGADSAGPVVVVVYVVVADVVEALGFLSAVVLVPGRRVGSAVDEGGLCLLRRRPHPPRAPVTVLVTACVAISFDVTRTCRVRAASPSPLCVTPPADVSVNVYVTTGTGTDVTVSDGVTRRHVTRGVVLGHASLPRVSRHAGRAGSPSVTALGDVTLS